MNNEEFFKYVKAKQFFPRYAKKVNSFHKKQAGTVYNGKPTLFTAEDLEEIEKGRKKFIDDCSKPGRRSLINYKP